jgi:hypothetical protein
MEYALQSGAHYRLRIYEKLSGRDELSPTLRKLVDSTSVTLNSVKVSDLRRIRDSIRDRELQETSTARPRRYCYRLATEDQQSTRRHHS